MCTLQSLDHHPSNCQHSFFTVFFNSIRVGVLKKYDTIPNLKDLLKTFLPALQSHTCILSEFWIAFCICTNRAVTMSMSGKM